jgi:kumamolisin
MEEVAMVDPDRIELAGSAQPAPSAGRSQGASDPNQHVTVTVYLRARPGGPDLGWIDGPYGGHPALSREEYAGAYGYADDDVATVEAFASQHHLVVSGRDQARRSLTLTGRLGDLQEAFGVGVEDWDDGAGGQFRVHTDPLTVPAELAGVVTGVFGLDERPAARSQHQLRPDAAIQYTPVQVASRYQYPAGANGSGQCVAIVELGGGYRSADLTAYFAQLDIPVPAIVAVTVDGATNAPGQPSGPDGEVMLDIEVVGAVAPGATIAVYFAPNTNKGFVDAISTAVHDATNRPSVVSISWGGPENTWPAQTTAQVEQTLQAAAAVGVTVTVAAGDSGSTDGETDNLQHVDFPASAPHALACGGTSLGASGETVWNDLSSGHGATGGGISAQFAVPSYQDAAHLPPSANPGGSPGRGVPDVAGDADPDTGYTVRVDGVTTVIGGTSAVAPLWAALVARLNQLVGHPIGFCHPLLYEHPEAFTDITQGSNGAYTAGPGWDACTGLGSPRGAELLAAFEPASRGRGTR